MRRARSSCYWPATRSRPPGSYPACRAVRSIAAPHRPNVSPSSGSPCRRPPRRLLARAARAAPARSLEPPPVLCPRPTAHSRQNGASTDAVHSRGAGRSLPPSALRSCALPTATAPSRMHATARADRRARSHHPASARIPRTSSPHPPPTVPCSHPDTVQRQLQFMTQ